MGKLDSAPEIIRIAKALKLSPTSGCVAEILRYCHDTIRRYIAEAGPIKNFVELQALVCTKLHLVFEEVWSDADVDRISKKYTGMGERIFGCLQMQLDSETFGSVFRREQVAPGAPDLHVAVIDCRGEKALRRYFTRWHEIAHLLVPEGDSNEAFDRPATMPNHPVEKLMDVIAGEFGFYAPLLTPVLNAELATARLLTFDGIQRIRQRLFPDASFQSVSIACVSRSSIPTISIEAALAYKKAEAVEIRSGQMSMFGGTTPRPKLRAIAAIPNRAARTSKFRVHRNFAIPASSLIAKHFEQVEAGAAITDGITGEEDLSMWRDSSGKPVGFGTVAVEAKRIGESFAVLLQRKPKAR